MNFNGVVRVFFLRVDDQEAPQDILSSNVESGERVLESIFAFALSVEWRNTLGTNIQRSACTLNIVPKVKRKA